MKFKWSLFAALSVVIAGTVVAPNHAAAQNSDGKPLLKLVPSDAWAYVVVPNFDQLESAVNMIQTETVGAPMFPVKPWLMMSLGINSGLDTAGSHGAVMLDQKKFGQESFALILSATDATDLLSNFNPEPAEDGISVCEVGFEKFYAQSNGKFLILARTPEVAVALKDVKDSVADKIAPQRLALYGKRQINLGIAASRIAIGYKNEIDGLLQMFAMASGGDPAQMDDVRKQISEMEWVDILIGIDNNGVTLNGLMTPVAGSSLAELTKSTKLGASQLAGLPAMDYLITYGQSVAMNESTKKQIDSALNSMLKQMSAQAENEADKMLMKELIETLASGVKTLEGVAMCANLLTPNADGAIGMTLNVTSSDPKKLCSDLGATVAKVSARIETEEPEMKGVLSYNVAAETIEGVSVDNITVDLNKADEMDEEDIANLRKMLGKDGLQIRMSAVDAKHLVVTLGGGSSYFAESVKAAKSGNAALASNAGIQKIGSFVPSQKSGEGYLNVEAALRAVKTVAKLMGEDDPIAMVPTMATPVSFVTSMDGDVTRIDLIIPMDVIRGVTQIAQQAMMGGGRPAPRNAPAPVEEGDDASSDDDTEEPMPG